MEVSGADVGVLPDEFSTAVLIESEDDAVAGCVRLVAEGVFVVGGVCPAVAVVVGGVCPAVAVVVGGVCPAVAVVVGGVCPAVAVVVGGVCPAVAVVVDGLESPGLCSLGAVLLTRLRAANADWLRDDRLGRTHAGTSPCVESIDGRVRSAGALRCSSRRHVDQFRTLRVLSLIDARSLSPAALDDATRDSSVEVFFVGDPADAGIRGNVGRINAS